MNIIAFLLILALLGLIGTIVLFYLTVKDYARTGRRAQSLVEPPINSGIEVYNRAQSIVLVSIERFTNAGKVVMSAATAVGECATVVSTLATDTAAKVSELKEEAVKLETTVGNANDTMKLVKQFVDIVQQARR
jgi:hypothetical protein